MKNLPSVYESLLSSSDDILFLIDASGVFLNVWTNNESVLILPKSQIIGVNFLHIVPAQFSEEFTEIYSKILSQKAPFEYNYHSPISGKIFFCRAQRVEIPGSSEYQVTARVRDISTIHKMEEREEIAKTIINNSPAVLFRWKPLKGWPILYVTNNISRFGYTEQDFYNNESLYESLIHPDDLKSIESHTQSVLNSEKDTIYLEYRLLKSDGNYTWIEEQSRIIRDPSGNIEFFEGVISDISQRIESAGKLKEKEDWYQNLLRFSTDIITILDDAGNVKYNSESFKKMYGADDLLIGKNIFQYVHPEDCDLALSEFQYGFSKPRGVSDLIHFRFRKITGEWVYLQTVGVNLFHVPGINGIVLTSRDISELYTAETSLQKINARLNAILESTTEDVYAIDRNLIYIAFNSAHRKSIKSRLGKLIRMGEPVTFDSSLLTEKGETMQQLVNDCFNGSLIVRSFILNENEEKKNKEVSFYPIREKSDKISGVAIICRDITIQEQAKEALRNAKNIAEEIARTKSDFLSNMSHEIRTPINAIMGVTDLLLEKEKDKEILEYLQTIKYSSDNLLVVINDILDFSKIESGNVLFERINFNLHTKLKSTISLFESKVKEKGLLFQLEIDHSVPAFVEGDPYRLHQILLNLLSNAIKFTAYGSVILSVKLLNKSGNEYRILFTVKDTGIGISADKQAHVFESFKQAYTDITRRFGGTGLGLAITQRLVTQQGGKIYLESMPDKGTTFYVEISLHEATGVFKDETPKSLGINFLKGKKALVAEDNAMNQLVIKRLLESWGVTYTVVTNGVDAISKLSEDDYDFILMDLQMPEMSGLQTTEIIRSRNSTVRNPHIPIIALTADAFPDTRRLVLEIGMNDFVSKPFKKEELQNKIASLFD